MNNQLLFRWLGSVVLVGLVLTLLGGLATYKYRQIQAAMRMPPPPEAPVSVTTATAEPMVFRQRATMIGTVLAPRSIVLSNEIAGTVSAIHFEPGQEIEQGQVLVELDTSVEQAQIASAQARKRIAASTFKRLGEAKEAVAPSELEEAEAALAQAEAEVNELNAVIQRKTLRAPFRAKVGLADTHEGQFLPSGADIVSLQSLEDFLYVDFMIPQSAAGSVDVGQLVQLEARQQLLQGEIIALDAQADPGSRNLATRLKLSSRPDSAVPSSLVAASLVPGESVKVLLEYGPPLQAVAVPAVALQSAPMNTFVYVVATDAEGQLRARERPVTQGPTVNGELCVTSGLNPGETVVADGAFKLRDGALVNALPRQPEQT